MSQLRFSFLSGLFLSKKFFSLFGWCSTFQFHFLWSLANHSFALALRLLLEQCKSEKGHKDIWPRNRQTKPKLSHKIIVLNSNFHHCKAKLSARLELTEIRAFLISYFLHSNKIRGAICLNFRKKEKNHFSNILRSLLADENTFEGCSIVAHV